MYSPALSLTSALDGLDGQRHAPVALPTLKTQYPLYRRLGGPQGRSGRVRKISPTPSTGIRSPDRPARSESPYRLSCPGPRSYKVALGNHGNHQTRFVSARTGARFSISHVHRTVGVRYSKYNILSSHCHTRTKFGAFKYAFVSAPLFNPVLVREIFIFAFELLMSSPYTTTVR